MLGFYIFFLVTAVQLIQWIGKTKLIDWVGHFFPGSIAKWARLRRKIDKDLVDLEVLNKEISTAKVQFASLFSSLLWTFTSGFQFVLISWYRRSPVFFIPQDWFPSPIVWILSFPSAPYVISLLFSPIFRSKQVPCLRQFGRSYVSVHWPLSERSWWTLWDLLRFSSPTGKSATKHESTTIAQLMMIKQSPMDSSSSRDGAKFVTSPSPALARVKPRHPQTA
ncbi:hypothetical protein H4Q26_000533 [Puccinia striiformis f. sp. tritici PST-130]|nr:hypothetical protein H4Q26_000533 [Puccinia striiformis f. sp. tritici PST-130]